ncbi:MAG: hypothetical protein ABEJ97_03000 [Halobellus sp.]
MVEFPWSRGAADGASGADDADHPEALVVCSFQDGTLVVYPDRVVIERVDRSRFDDKTIPVDEIEGVDLSNGITIGYIQIEQAGVPVDTGGLLSDPVNENTLHFGYGGRDCAAKARTEILAHATG